MSDANYGAQSEKRSYGRGQDNSRRFSAYNNYGSLCQVCCRKHVTGNRVCDPCWSLINVNDRAKIGKKLSELTGEPLEYLWRRIYHRLRNLRAKRLRGMNDE